MKENSTKKKLSIKKGKQFTKVSSSEFVDLIQEDLETPVCELYFCAIHKPQYFSGCSVPRYKVSVFLDPNLIAHKKYLDMLEKLAVENDVFRIGKMTDSGLVSMTYQGREVPKTYVVEEGKKKPVEIDLEHDLPAGFKCKITFDLKRYYDKYLKKNAFTYTPNKVIFYLDEETSELVEVNNGDRKSSGD